ncbi:MAG: metallophosphoesterase [Rectinemataceae bacterium]|nr:metallophosphoesterase [Rectinemataceae bacterium]
MFINWMGGSLATVRKRTLIWALAALGACLAMNAYHYSLEGAKGLYLWNRTGMFRGLILMGFIPLSVAILSLPLEKLKSKRASGIVRGLSIVLSALVILASSGLAALLVAGPRMGSLEPARLELIDPSKGIAPRGALATASLTPAFESGSSSANNARSPIVPAAALLRLSFSSDPHWGVDNSNASARTNILASVAEHKPDAFFMLGDTVETGSKAMQWNFALSDLEAIIPKVPLRPLMGNHDALLGGQYLFRKAFFPSSFSSNSGSPYYYSIDAKAATIVVINLPWGTESFGRRQKAWLEDVLKTADRTKPLIALSHSYFYASGYDDPDLDKPWYDHYQNIPALSPLFEKYGVDLVVSGHNHYQEYLEHNGVRYAIIGAMGGKSDPEPAYISPASKWLAVASFGRLDLDVLATEVVLSFRDENGELLHEERFGY